MKDLLVVLLHVLAVNGIVEAWHHGSIFVPVRARIESSWLPRADLLGKLAEGLLCPFCVSYWVSAAVTAVSWWMVDGWSPPAVFLLWFGGARGAQLLNDVLARWLRTPNRSGEQIGS